MSPIRMTDQRQLRHQLRQRRLALSHTAQARASRALLDRLLRLPQFHRARHVALYFGTRGELDPSPLLDMAEALGKTCYLPVLHPFRTGRLWFCRWRPGEPLRPNRFGIAEPTACGSRMRAPRHLDLVLVPLLGFDAACNRLGMGGGFYDRTFAFRHQRSHITRPYLLGVAHDFQRVDRLQVQPWDVRLDAVLTERTLYHARS